MIKKNFFFFTVQLLRSKNGFSGGKAPEKINLGNNCHPSIGIHFWPSHFYITIQKTLKKIELCSFTDSRNTVQVSNRLPAIERKATCSTTPVQPWARTGRTGSLRPQTGQMNVGITSSVTGSLRWSHRFGPAFLFVYITLIRMRNSNLRRRANCRSWFSNSFVSFNCRDDEGRIKASTRELSQNYHDGFFNWIKFIQVQRCQSNILQNRTLSGIWY